MKNFLIALVNELELKERLTEATELTIPLPVAAWHMAGSLFAMIVWWLDNDMPHSPEEMADLTQRACLQGLLSQPIDKEPF